VSAFRLKEVEAVEMDLDAVCPWCGVVGLEKLKTSDESPAWYCDDCGCVLDACSECDSPTRGGQFMCDWCRNHEAEKAELEEFGDA
jgi:hypothetical protein